MKYWIIPTLIEIGGIIFALLILIPAYKLREINLELMIGGIGCALGLMAVMNTFAQSHRNDHLKRILQKHGLWQDDLIKKKELKKDK